ncbi:hypothetical protein BDF22DRAFT_679104 [Syncephalis plumigaleata]|nr:hypothetical protein BDF22DRAFT_679104 [Syncephalis plumigaleata]
MSFGFSGIYEQANCLNKNVKQRALMLDLEYNLSRRTSARRVSATMLAGRLLTEHRVQLAALATLAGSNNDHLDESRCHVTLDGFMQKLGRLLDHSPGILEIILMTIAIGDADCITKERDTSNDNHQHESVSTSAVDENNTDGSKMGCVKHSCITEVATHLNNTMLTTASSSSSSCKEAKQQVDWRACQQQLLDWLLARPSTYVNRVYYLHPALLAEVAECRLRFADVYTNHLLQLTRIQLKAQQHPSTSTGISKGTQMGQLIRKHFQQLCTFVSETSVSNHTTTTTTTDEPLDESAKISLKQYLVKFGIEL